MEAGTVKAEQTDPQAAERYGEENENDEEGGIGFCGGAGIGADGVHDRDGAWAWQGPSRNESCRGVQSVQCGWMQCDHGA